MMKRRPNVIFCVAAGPRLGFGHLVRSRVLAGALGVRPRICLRGTPSTRATVRAMGWELVGASQVWRGCFDLMVIDDPCASQVARHARRARRDGIPVASIDDVRFRGPAWAILHPDVRAHRARSARRRRGHVVIALGGGSAVRAIGPRLAARIRRLVPDARIQLAAGFATTHRMPDLPAGCTWMTASSGLADSLARTSVAVVAGGVTAYEACALRTPTVGLAVVPAQRPTVRSLARAGALREAPGATVDAAAARAAEHVASLLGSPTDARRLGRRAGAVVDGWGARRVTTHLRGLLKSDEENLRAA